MTVPSGEIVWPSNSEGFTRVMLTGEENPSKNGSLAKGPARGDCQCLVRRAG
jgi:hypothetical protein